LHISTLNFLNKNIYFSFSLSKVLTTAFTINSFLIYDNLSHYLAKSVIRFY